MNRIEWAKKEAELACSKCNGRFSNYYEIALKVYQYLLDFDVGGKIDLQIIKEVLNKLIDGTCLTPIEDCEDDWILFYTTKEGVQVFQNLRYPYLFKDMNNHGKEIEFYDINRVMVRDTVTATDLYYSPLADKIIHKMFPITFPYTPEKDPFIVYIHAFEVSPELVGDDYSTIGIFYCVKPGEFGNKIDIYRYFKLVEGDYVEIDLEEYRHRHKNQLKNRYSPWRILGMEPEVINENGIRIQEMVEFETISKETILKLHRALWLWKAEEIQKNRKAVCNHDYFDFFDFPVRPINECWLCEYALNQHPEKIPSCKHCLIRSWKNDEHPSSCSEPLKRLISLFTDKKWEEAAKLCKEIAEVKPE